MKVQLKSIDEGNPNLFYTARYVDIKPSSKTIHTPLRIINNVELNAKAGAGIDISLDSPIAGIHKSLNNTTIKELLTTNSAPEKLIKWLENYSQQLQHSMLKLPLIQPPDNSFEGILKDKKNKDKLFRILYKIQKEANLDYICVPWFNYNVNETIKFYDTILKNCDDDFILYLNSTSNPYDLKLVSDFLKEHIESDRIHFIGVLGKPARTVINSYDTLWEGFRESNVVLLLSDMERVDVDKADNSNVSCSHLNEFIIGDLFMAKAFSGGGSKKKEFNVYDRLKFFNRNDLSVKPIIHYPSESEWIDDIANTLNNYNIRNKLENFEEANNNQEKYNTLNYISKIHEFVQSLNEFKISQGYIKKEESSAYIDNKNSLNVGISHTKRIRHDHSFF